VYQFHVIANGWTHRGEAFTREQLLTGVTVVGGNSPSPTTQPPDSGSKLLCCLLDRLLGTEALGRFLAQHNIDPAALQRSLRACCDTKSAPPSPREIAEAEGTVLTEPSIVGRLSELLSRPEFADAMRKLEEVGGES
jgi:hypothetical protein